LTAARIGLRRTGASLATGPLLDFRLAHARARDAVHEPLDEARLGTELAAFGGPVLTVASLAEDRQRFLMRPDLGRRLAPDSQGILLPHADTHDVVFVIAGGLSARAVQTNAPPVLAATVATLRADGWQIAPFVIVRHGRVAIGGRCNRARGAVRGGSHW
jgi:ethanolamine ammonia-lyase small subunit